MKEKVCAIFDIGRDTKRLLIFNERFEKIGEEAVFIDNLTDEDGFRTENVLAIKEWILSTFESLRANTNFDLQAVNFTGYGGAMVHLDESGEPLLPNYDVLKPIGYAFRKLFFEEILRSDSAILKETQSPFLGQLNAGVRLFWLKHHRPDVYKKIKTSLFLPQYGCYLLSGVLAADFSSLQCHSMLWDKDTQTYHAWILTHGISKTLPKAVPFSETYPAVKDATIKVGVGLQNTAATLLPYLQSDEPFVLSASRTWTVNSNPFAKKPLSEALLKEHAFAFELPHKTRVYASRVFAGNEHERQVKHLSDYFEKPLDYHQTVAYNPELVWSLRNRFQQATPDSANSHVLFDCPFVERNLNQFKDYEEAYHQFMQDLVAQEVSALKLVLGYSNARKIIIEGEFTNNNLYVQLMNEAFFDKIIFVNRNGDSGALGAAMVIAADWSEVPTDGVSLELERI